MKLSAILKSAIPVVAGLVIFATLVKVAVDQDIPFIKDLRDAFDA